METHALHDLDDKGQGDNLPNGKIHVTEDMSHTSHTATRV